MRNKTIRQHRGFTLVELLIVIAIIMVLAALGFAGVQSALKKARTVQTLNLVTNTSQAIHNFFDEYGSLPTANATPAPVNTNSAEGVNVLRVLLAQEGVGDTALNTKGIRYLDVKTAKARKAGVEFAAGGTVVTAMYDAWGDPLWMAFDEDYNDEIVNPVPNSPADPQIIRGMKAIVYSYGADRTERSKDDVRSW